MCLFKRPEFKNTVSLPDGGYEMVWVKESRKEFQSATLSRYGELLGSLGL
ncbi:hypothetical protein [Sulfuracidifex metallicus]|nr:hypothetical protein [Sulfuracidifex metallicus]